MDGNVLVLTECELCLKNRALQKCVVAGKEMWLCRDCILKVFKKLFPDDPVAKFYIATENENDRK